MIKNQTVGGRPMGRRDFLNYAIGAAVLLWAGLAGTTFFRVLTPPERRQDGSSKLDWLTVGPVSTFTEKPKPVFYGEETVYVYRLSGRLVAYSATCPHVRCVVRWVEKDGTFQCPCHASAFDKAGKKLHGPALRGLWAQRVRVQDGQVALGGGTPPA